MKELYLSEVKLFSFRLAPSDKNNLLARLEKVYLNYEDAGLIETKIRVTNNRGLHDYDIELVFDLDKVLSYININKTDFKLYEQEDRISEFDEIFKITPLYDNLLDSFQAFIDKYDESF